MRFRAGTRRAAGPFGLGDDFVPTEGDGDEPEPDERANGEDGLTNDDESAPVDYVDYRAPEPLASPEAGASTPPASEPPVTAAVAPGHAPEPEARRQLEDFALEHRAKVAEISAATRAKLDPVELETAICSFTIPAA